MIKIISTVGEFMTQATTLLSLNMNSNHRGGFRRGGGGNWVASHPSFGKAKHKEI